MDRDVSTARCLARAALAGNPSDLFGGAVVAVPVESVGATVGVTASDTFQIPGLDRFPSSLDELDHIVETSGCGTAQPLVVATLVTLWRRFQADLSPVMVDVETGIPRSVGLAGSSAIVVATIRALISHQPHRTWARRLAADPWLLASTALGAETSVLGITAGMQDRLVQAIGENLFMDFSRHPTDHSLPTDQRFRVLGPLPGVAFVALLPATASHSGAVHARTDTSTASFTAAMGDLARTAHDAAWAIDAHDADGLGAAMNATFDLRASCMALEPAHVAMVVAARRRGAAATYTGSGGAVTVLCSDDDAASDTAAALRRDLGCQVLPLP